MVKNPDPAIYNRKFFDTFYPSKGPIAEEIEAREKRALEFLKPRNKKLLDIGCGFGGLVFKAAGMGAECIGTDYSKEAVGLALEKKRRLPKRIGSKVDFRVMDAINLEFKDEFFDAAVSIDTIEHIYPKPLEKAFMELDRVVKKGGIIVIRTAPNVFFEAPFHILGKIILRKKELETEKYHVNLHNVISLRKYTKLVNGRTNIYLFNDGKQHFSTKIGQMKIPDFVKATARIIDGLLDSKIGTRLATESPLKVVLGRDIWIIIQK